MAAPVLSSASAASSPLPGFAGGFGQRDFGSMKVCSVIFASHKNDAAVVWSWLSGGCTHKRIPASHATTTPISVQTIETGDFDRFTAACGSRQLSSTQKKNRCPSPPHVTKLAPSGDTAMATTDCWCGLQHFRKCQPSVQRSSCRKKPPWCPTYHTLSFVSIFADAPVIHVTPVGNARVQTNDCDCKS